MSESFTCTNCKIEHAGLPTDWGYQEPDEIFSLSYLDKYRRTHLNSDLATLDDSRYFIRGVLSLPFTEQEGYFGLGVWVEVAKCDHDAYIRHSDQDGTLLPRFSGKIANDIAGYPDSLGIQLDVQLGNSDDRPMFWLLNGTNHPLALDQENGISSAKHHQLLEACGYFEKEEVH